MSAKTETIAVLNGMAGKGVTRKSLKRKLHLDPNDLEFSPKKTANVSLPRRKSNRQENHAVSTEKPVARVVPVQNKRRLPKLQPNKPTQQSPFKGDSFDMELRIPNDKINLNDSPAERTRAKGPSDFIELSQSKQPVSQSSFPALSKKTPKLPPKSLQAKKSGRRASRPILPNQTREEEIDEPRKQDRPLANSRRGAANQSNIADDSELRERDQEFTETVVTGDGGTDSSDIEVQMEQSSKQTPSQKIDKQRSTAKSSTRKSSQKTPRRSIRPTSPVATPTLEEPIQKTSRREVRIEADREKAKRAKDSALQAARAEAKRRQKEERIRELMEDREAELETWRQKFAKRADQSTMINGCQEEWITIGGVRLWLMEIYGREDSESTPARALCRTIAELKTAYRESISSSQPTDHQNESDQIPRLINKLENRLDLLVSHSFKKGSVNTNESNKHSMSVGTDLYCHVIPATVELLRVFFRVSYRKGPFKGPVALDLGRLLNVLIRMCYAAKTWNPTPVAVLEFGSRSLVHNYLLSSVLDIQGKFMNDIDEAQTRLRRQEEAILMDRLEELQKARWEQWERKRIRRLSRSRAWTFSQTTFMTAREGLVYDVDDLESEYEQPEAAPTRKPPVVRLQRQTTEEIPAPPFDDWSEVENTALLNGLQLFQSKTRYTDILNAYSTVLRYRDIDNLMSQAKYFRQVMTDSGAYDVDDLAWLLSVE